MASYANLRDVYDEFEARAFVRVPRGPDARQGEYLDTATGIFRMTGHGLEPDDLVEFVLVGGPANGANIVPSGGSVNVAYYPLKIDGARFKLSLSQGGAPVAFTDTGKGGWALHIDPENRLLRLCETVSDEIDQDLVAHSTPILVDPVTHKYPRKLAAIVAREVARRAIRGMTFENPAWKAASEQLVATTPKDEAQRERWRGGEPLLPQALDQTDTPDDTMKAGNSSDIAREGLGIAWVSGMM